MTIWLRGVFLWINNPKELEEIFIRVVYHVVNHRDNHVVIPVDGI